jgi:hypothetical protein
MTAKTDGQKCRELADKIYALTGESLFAGVSQGVYYCSPENFRSGGEAVEYLTTKLAEARQEVGE